MKEAMLLEANDTRLHVVSFDPSVVGDLFWQDLQTAGSVPYDSSSGSGSRRTRTNSSRDNSPVNHVGRGSLSVYREVWDGALDAHDYSRNSGVPFHIRFVASHYILC